jgi:hypothetical protein
MRAKIADWEDSRFELSTEAVRRPELEVKEFCTYCGGESGRII